VKGPWARHHADARRLEVLWRGAALLTSNAVVAETWTFLRRRAGDRLAMTWFDGVRAAPRLTCERIDDELETEAWAWLRVHDERAYSLVDATSFALMRKRRLTDSLAFDGDFAAAGFNELRATV
jgi:predicted nucleic acid-binding protein